MSCLKIYIFSHIKKYLYKLCSSCRWTGLTHSQMCFLEFSRVCVCESVSLVCVIACSVTAAPCRGRVRVLRLSSYVESFSQSGSLGSRVCPLPHLAAAAAATDVLPLLLQSAASFLFSISPVWGRALTDGLLAGQRRLQGRAGRGQVWTGAGLKHGGDVEGLEARETSAEKKSGVRTTHAANHPAVY